jgi:GntR family transcriptional repressor for pyruvate dehydrogenase complex
MIVHDNWAADHHALAADGDDSGQLPAAQPLVALVGDVVPRPDAQRYRRDEHRRAEQHSASRTVNAATPVHTPKAAEVVAQTLRGLIVAGELKPGDHLPNEPHLMRQFVVSRSTLREAVRLLESEHLVEVKRGARTGARVTLPGPETLARPARFLLQVSGATLADVTAARSGIEPVAVNLLARKRTQRDVQELETILAEDLPAAWASAALDLAVAEFHRRLVELSGNVTLSLIAAMLFEITEQHTRRPSRRVAVSKPQFQRLLRAHRDLIDLVRVGDADGAEAHWRQHLDANLKLMPNRLATIKVRDIID